METFIDRLKAEKSDLDERREKLDSFINSEAFHKIDPVHMSLMNIQYQAMTTYSQCLTERLSRL